MSYFNNLLKKTVSKAFSMSLWIISLDITLKTNLFWRSRILKFSVMQQRCACSAKSVNFEASEDDHNLSPRKVRAPKTSSWISNAEKLIIRPYFILLECSTSMHMASHKGWWKTLRQQQQHGQYHRCAKAPT